MLLLSLFSSNCGKMGDGGAPSRLSELSEIDVGFGDDVFGNSEYN
jgi:hypothetical protein